MKSKSKLLIIGAGGHGLVVADAAIERGIWSEIAFLDDVVKGELLTPKCKVIGVTADAVKLVDQYQDLFVAIGNNEHRLELINDYSNIGFNIPTILHPRSTISNYAEVGLGSFVAANAVLGVRVRIGKGCIINTSATVDHECLLSEGVHISPGAHLGGRVQVGRCSWIGIGASVREQIYIGKEVVVGAGAAVVSKVDDMQLMLGVPAIPKKTLRVDDDD